jgi:hypothetical protein
MDRSSSARKLYDSRLMKTPAEVKSFEDAQVELFADRDPAVLPDFFAAFDDSTQHEEVMWGLVHTVEGFDLKDYLGELGKTVPKLLPRAKNWALLLHQRVMNTKKALPIYRTVVASLPPEAREAVTKLLEEVRTTSPNLAPGVAQVLGEKAVAGKKSAKKAAKKSAQPSAKKAAPKPAKKTAKEPGAKQAAKKSGKKSGKKSAKKATKKSGRKRK